MSVEIIMRINGEPKCRGFVLMEVKKIESTKKEDFIKIIFEDNSTAYISLKELVALIPNM